MSARLRKQFPDQAVREQRDLKRSPCMSYSHCAEPLPVPSRTAALGTLRARGLRISATRRLVIDALFDAAEPVTSVCRAISS